MKKVNILVACGSGVATSTIAEMKSKHYVKNMGFTLV